MSVVVEVVDHLHAEKRAAWVFRAQLVQNVDLKLSGVTILFHISNDLHRTWNVLRTLQILNTDYFPECSFTQRFENFISMSNDISDLNKNNLKMISGITTTHHSITS